MANLDIVTINEIAISQDDTIKVWLTDRDDIWGPSSGKNGGNQCHSQKGTAFILSELPPRRNPHPTTLDIGRQLYTLK